MHRLSDHSLDDVEELRPGCLHRMIALHDGRSGGAHARSAFGVVEELDHGIGHGLDVDVGHDDTRRVLAGDLAARHELGHAPGPREAEHRHLEQRRLESHQRIRVLARGEGEEVEGAVPVERVRLEADEVQAPFAARVADVEVDLRALAPPGAVADPDEVHVVARQARQVGPILSDQERHANVPPVMEELDIAEILDEAVLVVPTGDHPDVEICMAEPSRGCRVKAHRVGLLQVLGNVILNAYEAIKRGPSGSGRIRLQARVETLGDQPMVRVTVSDTGCGFDPQAKSRIFQRGYTSKVGHMSGLGLHWCANALAGMGGRIVAESTGPGQGAEFHVLLPAAQGG